jgi:uncharacterized protein YuzE
MQIFPCPYLNAEVELTDEREAHIADAHPDLMPEFLGQIRQTLANPDIGKWRARMAEKLTFQYDREGDILYINTVTPYAAQESEELGDEIIARLNPKTRKIENLEILFFSSRLLRKELFSVPVIADLKQAEVA